ncbi:serine protease inhibitor Kazal-type 6-like [Gopherus flavomarginatus]|uniref:serine protease inhibitor Kazal-type 6-like n=1 Tax=Gopherus flavomarginatus TaxID=286002 RepID=UPI0021CBBE04|nr:serine protease inhibitor Kazal-type 6-like [Gopherus flavomarginatus]
MKIAGVIVLLILAAFCCSDVASHEGKTKCDYDPKNDPILCPTVQECVCAADGRTYRNSCYFGRAMRATCGKLGLKHLGPCHEKKKA